MSLSVRRLFGALVLTSGLLAGAGVSAAPASASVPTRGTYTYSCNASGFVGFATWTNGRATQVGSWTNGKVWVRVLAGATISFGSSAPFGGVSAGSTAVPNWSTNYVHFQVLAWNGAWIDECTVAP